MNLYSQFHGEIMIDKVGQELRAINKKEKGTYKILTGYGSVSGSCKSREAAIKSLRNMRREKLIKGFITGDKLVDLLLPNDEFYSIKLENEKELRKDKDYGNDGIIFIIK